MRARVTITGIVQGVGFRFFLAQKAEELGITGWVKNRKDGSLEADFQAVTHAPNEFVQFEADKLDKAKVEEMIEACKQGPSLSHVENVQVKWEGGEEEYEGFEIR